MKLKLTINIVLICGIAAVMTGCDPSDQVLQTFHASTAKAENSTTPYGTYKTLRAAQDEALEACSKGSAFIDCSQRAYREINDNTQIYAWLGKALDSGSPSAYYELLNESSQSPEWNSLRKNYTEKLVSFADASSGTPSDALLLAAAGSVFAEGRLALQDSRRAVGYYARAWQAGYTQAPVKIADIFIASNDPVNAYLWLVRCIGDCARPYSIMENQAERLDARTISAAQHVAADPSVVTLNAAYLSKE